MPCIPYLLKLHQAPLCVCVCVCVVGYLLIIEYYIHYYYYFYFLRNIRSEEPSINFFYPILAVYATYSLPTHSLPSTPPYSPILLKSSDVILTAGIFLCSVSLTSYGDWNRSSYGHTTLSAAIRMHYTHTHTHTHT